MNKPIIFNKPYITGNELKYVTEVTVSGKLSGGGKFTKWCTGFFEEKYNIKKAFLTTSCTDALEMASLLLDIKPGDEVIAPAYTYVSTANAFVLRGAKILFADSNPLNPNIDADSIEKLISPRTKVIIAVHYAGIACDMDKIMGIAKAHNLYVVEDAAQAVDSYYKGKALGSIGHIGAISFHETKNVISGEGGLMTINDDQFYKRAEIISEKGTNKSSFMRGEINNYEWVDIGSSFLASEITAAFLRAQLESMESIQKVRKKLWDLYYSELNAAEKNGFLKRPFIPEYAEHNAHIFYIVLNSSKERMALIQHLKSKNISAVFHFLSLNKSHFYKNQGTIDLTNSDRYTDCLLRLPMYYELTKEEIVYICEQINSFFENNERLS
ncbi:MAG: dTDP-4-amino-4,6-dideoxygalactose transaminase [Bacteroidota bacterium]